MTASTWLADTQPFSLGKIATAVLDRDGTVLRWSQAAAELLDRTAEEVCGHPVTRLLVDDTRCRAEDGGIALPEAGRTVLRHRSGGEVEADFRVLPLEPDAEFLVLAAPSGWVSAWEEDSALSRALFAQVGIGIGILDADLSIVRTHAMSEMFGAPSPSAGGRMADVMSELDAETVEGALRRVLETGMPLIGYQQQARSPWDGARRWYFTLSAFRLEDAGGQPTGVAVLVTDAIDAARERRTRRYLELRHQASTRIGESLDVTRTSQELVDVLVPELGDLATVSLVEAVLHGDEPKMLSGGELHGRRVAVASASGHWPEVLLQPGETTLPIPDTPDLERFQHGEAVILDRAAAAVVYGDPEAAQLYIPEGGHTALWAPLFARGLVLGAVVVWRTDQPEPYDQQDAELLTEIVSRAALSVDNARRYTREHRANLALQQRLLPRATTDTPAARTAGAYLPAGGGAEVSGDWFDVLPLPSLRVAFVVGDVIGHGLPATATMGRLRTAVQTLADLELDPTELLTRLDGLVARLAAEAGPDQRDTVGATCLYAVYDPITRRCALASAGHPPPILLRPDGTADVLDVSPGPPLGVGGLPFETIDVDLEPGSVLALYTDGLITHDDRDPGAGLRQLTARLAAHSPPDHPLVDTCRALLEDIAEGPSHDDIALLLARTRALPAEATAAWEFPADPTVVTEAREASNRQLAAWELDELAFTTELVVSELVTNAIRYAGGPVGLRLILDDDVLICEVTDPSNTQPRLRRAATTDEGGRGLFVVAQLTDRWGSRYGPAGKTIWTEQRLGRDRGTA